MDRAYLIEVARRASGLTQTELAARSGTSQATISSYERGLKSPTIKVAGRILEAAGYDEYRALFEISHTAEENAS